MIKSRQNEAMPEARQNKATAEASQNDLMSAAKQNEVTTKIRQDKITPEIKQAVLRVAKNGRISCAEARRIAGELGVPVKLIGRVADELKIKIFACELGCF